MKVRLPSFAYSENLKVRDDPIAPPVPQGVRALELLQMVYRGEVKVSSQQMRAAIEALPHESPRMSAVAVGYLTNDTFAEKLERAILRSAKVINAKPLALPPPRLR
jgi:hypothetical protein